MVSSTDDKTPIITHLQTSDSDEMCEFIQGWDQEYYQLNRGRFAWEIHNIQIGEFQIFEEYFGTPTFIRGAVPSGTCAIGFPYLLSGTTQFLGNDIDPTALLSSNYSQQFEFKSGQQYKMIVLLGPISQVLACADAMNQPLEEKDLRPQGLMIPNPDAAQQLRQYLTELFTLVKAMPAQIADQRSGPWLQSIILADLLPLFIDVLTVEPKTFLVAKPSKARRLVQQTEDFMQAHIDQPITLQELCQVVGKSQRSLYYAFHQVFGLPPMEYLKVLRLNQVHRLLRRSDPQSTQVSAIALRFGFWHRSQFTKDYKAMFGETPSITLRKH